MFSFGLPQIDMDSRGLSLSLVLYNHSTRKEYTVCLTISDKAADKQFNDTKFRSRLASYSRSIEASQHRDGRHS
jgi:hypothetical protein